MPPESNQIPTVTDKRTTPPGILPPNIHHWVLGGLAVLMVVVIAFSGRSNPKSHPSQQPTPNAPMAPNPERLDQYKRQIDEESQRLKAEQAELDRTRKVWATTAGQAQPGSARPGANFYRASSDNYQPNAETPRNLFREEMEKREFASRFSSNLAKSVREQPKTIDPASSLPATQAPPLDPRLYASLVSPLRSFPMAQTTTDDGSQESVRSPERAEGGSAKLSPAELKESHGKDYRLFEGTIIETALTNRLDGTFSGPVNCIVSYDVYSHDHRHILIPAGSRVLGEVHAVESSGQQRLAVTFDRIIMPDGFSVNLHQFHGLDQVGETGLRDKVNHHYLQIFGTSIAIGMIAGLAQSNTDYGTSVSAADAYRQGVANSLSQSSMHILDRFLNVLPTFTIHEGQRIKIYLAEDLSLPAYENHEMPDDI
jgi:type IV secretory pathway VirB10-like protein